MDRDTSTKLLRPPSSLALSVGFIPSAARRATVNSSEELSLEMGNIHRDEWLWEKEISSSPDHVWSVFFSQMDWHQRADGLGWNLARAGGRHWACCVLPLLPCSPPGHTRSWVLLASACQRHSISKWEVVRPQNSACAGERPKVTKESTCVTDYE